MSAQSVSGGSPGTAMPNVRRYYCHNCQMYFRIRDPDFEMVCPICSSDFVEELSLAPPTARSVSNISVMGSAPGSRDYITVRTINRPAFRLLPAVLRAQAASRAANADNGRNGRSAANSVNAHQDNEAGPSTSRAQSTQQLNNLDRFMMDFMQMIAVAEPTRGAGPPQMFMLGNNNDFAFDLDSMENIITQLMNAAEDSGPPPMPKEMIDQIPKVKITPDEAKSHLQCSVCQDDFQPTEIVRQLPCTHKYHENCIIPWLEIHATCPICRKEFRSEAEQVDASEVNPGDVPNAPTNADNSAGRPAAGSDWVYFPGSVFGFDNSDLDLD